MGKFFLSSAARMISDLFLLRSKPEEKKEVKKNAQRMSARENFDEILKLEAKVVDAMSRLQKSNKGSSRSKGNLPEISSQEIVDYLTANNRYLDGDIESQVITALLSCVKSGIICAQENGKYRLVGANPRLMASNCLTRCYHGSKCSCLNIISFMSKICPSNCCTLRASNRKSGKKSAKRILKRKSATRDKCKKKRKEWKNCNRVRKPKCVRRAERRCADVEFQAMDEDDSEKNGKKKKKCDYCFDRHQNCPEPEACKDCYTLGFRCGFPSSKSFSYHEEAKRCRKSNGSDNK